MIHKHQFIVADPDLLHQGIKGARIVCIDPACEEVREVWAHKVFHSLKKTGIDGISMMEKTHVVVIEEGLDELD